MQINLKQNEIEAALKGYITAQGISLGGKSVSISFTAGRKESGLSAEVIIDDVDLPDFVDEEAEVVTTCDAIKPITNSVLRGDVTTLTNGQSAVAHLSQPEEVKAAEATEQQEGKTTSLFG